MPQKTRKPNDKPFNEAAWMRVMRDLPPAQCVKTTRGVAIAAKAQWQQREPVEELLRDYAMQWHQAGWKPKECWQLAITLTLCRALEPNSVHSGRRIVKKHEQHPRELSLEITPEHWKGWRELAVGHGALRATLTMLMDAGMREESAIHWAKKPVRISELTYLEGVKLFSTADGSPINTPGPPQWQIILIDPFKSSSEQ